MKTFFVFCLILYSSKAYCYEYIKSDFFSHFSKLQKQANKQNKPIVLVAGFEGCLGCDELKEKVKQNETKFMAIAEFFWMSTLVPESYLFYNTLGIKRIASAPKTYLIKPHSNSAIPLDRQIDIKVIQDLMKTEKPLKKFDSHQRS